MLLFLYLSLLSRLYLCWNTVWRWGLNPHEVSCSSPRVLGYLSPLGLSVYYHHLTINMALSNDISHLLLHAHSNSPISVGPVLSMLQKKFWDLLWSFFTFIHKSSSDLLFFLSLSPTTQLCSLALSPASMPHSTCFSGLLTTSSHHAQAAKPILTWSTAGPQYLS